MSELESTPGIPDTLGVSISGQANVTAHDIIGRDKIIHGDEYIGYTAAQVILLLDKIRVEYQTKPFDGRSPYIGLASFQERDADRFFGRETLTAELVTRVATSAASNARALFVAGPSGSGKSSLVRAGLIPALRRGAPLWSPALGSEHWLYETCKPGRAPLDELGLAVAKLARNADLRSAMTTRGLTDATFLNQQADMALTDDKNQRVVLVIDQFEEIFTQLSPDREAERVAFLQQLTHAATVENGRVLVIFTLRSDFVSNCASYPNLNALVNQQFIQVGAMTPAELVSAIARPAYQVGLRLDPALISQIVNDVRGEPGALPLMQFALQDLFEAEKHKGELTLDGYTARGGLRQALERHADAEFAKLDDAEKQLARTVFSGLVEIGRGREDTKRTARFGELVPAGADESRVQALVRELADARLITTDEQDGKETVTLAHERLIGAWDWLRKLVNENRDAIALQNEIAQDAQEWDKTGRSADYLYRGGRLALVRESIAAKHITLAKDAQVFLNASVNAHRRAQIQRILIPLGIVLGTLLLLIAGFLAYRETLRQRALAASVPISIVNLPLRVEPYEVTNQRYQWCVEAGACSPPFAWGKYYEKGGEKFPVTFVDFVQATEFCRWQLRRLPTMDEWRAAATNNGKTRWPWGNYPDPQPGYANLNYEEPSMTQQIEPVGKNSKGGSVNGIYDLIGNGWEWTRTEGDETGQSVSDWESFSSSRPRILMLAGGSYELTLTGLMSTESAVPAAPFFRSGNATSFESDLSFRCVE
ncbi:MAG: hypothetical protein B6D41_16605 [Chloroflexi bacterium UTCFX4]|nr:MAG: hypothetical protein B6D41_16605 [Chloroflexi bacterium UTCFX4]